MKHYILTVGDALSQLINAALFFSGNADEALSGRCHRQRDHWFFGKLGKVIDTVAAWFGDYGHCARIYRKDKSRASYMLQGRPVPEEL